MKILDFLRTSRTHPSAEQVHAHVRKQLPSITLATVYRNLNLLAEQGIITKLKVNNAYHYDGHEGPHEHAICTHCGRIIDIEGHEQAAKAARTAKIRGFTVTNARLTLYGTCKNCTRKEP